MRKRFALRTIRNGRVRINGATYTPKPTTTEHCVAYAGQLDGQRWVFGLYYVGDEQQPFVSLWGTEQFYRDESAAWPGPNCIGGYFQWEWWDRQTGDSEGRGEDREQMSPGP